MNSAPSGSSESDSPIIGISLVVWNDSTVPVTRTRIAALKASAQPIPPRLTDTGTR